MTADLANGSLHETLGRAGFVLRGGTSTIGAAAATPEDARLLEVRIGDPLLVERRVIADGHGRRIEATESRYPADRYGLDVAVRRRGAGPRAGRCGRRHGQHHGARRAMSSGPAATSISGRLVLDDRVAGGRITIEDGRITAVDLDDGDASDADGPFIAPGFVDVHVHGWGGHDAMGDLAALDGMARALLRRGVTSFLPTAVTAPLPDLVAFAERVRSWLPGRPGRRRRAARVQPRGTVPRRGRRGAHDPTHLRVPADVSACDARAAHRRAPAADHRARAARRDGPHPLAP